jgi:hypothetical protein
MPDFDWWLLNASLVVDLTYASTLASPSHVAQHGHADDMAPAGVMFAHMLPNAGEWMTGLRVAATRQAGPFRNGTQSVDDAQLRAYGCGNGPCVIAPSSMSASMVMLELMYAPADWVTLMVMPTYMNMDMQSRGLLTPAEQGALPPDVQAMITHHAGHEHTSGGVGDTGFYATFRVLDAPGSSVLATLWRHRADGRRRRALPRHAPGRRRLPALRHAARQRHLGRQSQHHLSRRNGRLVLRRAGERGHPHAGRERIRLCARQHRAGNRVGRLGRRHRRLRDVARRVHLARVDSRRLQRAHLQAVADGRSCQLRRALLGRGFGVGYALNGAFTGNHVAIEWMQPVHDDFNGYQLTRRGTLNAVWNYAF